MRLRKNLRIWTVVLLCAALLCSCAFLIKNNGEPASPKPETTESETQPPTTQPPTTEPPVTLPPLDQLQPDNRDVDDSILAGTAIIGNSRILALQSYGVIKSADFYAQVGLTVQTAHSYVDPATNLPLVQAVCAKPHQRVMLMFGENELGWPYPENFIKLYKEIVTGIQAGLPDAVYYIVGITPIGQATSEKGTNGVTMEHAVQFNQMLREMAAELNATFLDSWPVLLDKNTGYLSADASADGIHLNLNYCKIWTNNMIEQIRRNET